MLDKVLLSIHIGAYWLVKRALGCVVGCDCVSGLVLKAWFRKRLREDFGLDFRGHVIVRSGCKDGERYPQRILRTIYNIKDRDLLGKLKQQIQIEYSWQHEHWILVDNQHLVPMWVSTMNVLANQPLSLCELPVGRETNQPQLIQSPQLHQNLVHSNPFTGLTFFPGQLLAQSF